ncbi:sugar phosphate permease [Scopulibacillus darangshiensis]|uniref:Sugar phosphate permease n=1 Tax=Scopulibacillus darangshiensis TaxID=442528 RepID=A0A4V2SLK1_9BACL|nr:MFS transporter [Scopulibacillus darangshiensis]TCP23736.1 sugar phosphate permease [Scopulibacillus darangshiensis]
MGSTLKNNKHFILGLLFTGWLLDYLDRMVMSVAVVAIAKDFSLEPGAVGAVLSSFFAGYAIMQIPGGWLSDKFGSRKMLIVSIIFWSIFTVLSGLAWSLISLLVIRFLFGIGEGGYPSASQKAISDFFPKKERAKASSTMMSSNSFGLALAPLVAAPMMVWMGWRLMFIVMGVLGIVMAIIFWKYVRPEKERAISSEEQTANKVPMKTLLKSSVLWKIVLMWFGADILVWGLAGWMPSYLVDVRGMDILSIAIVAALPGIASGIAVVVGGRLVHKFFNGREKYFTGIGMVFASVCLYFMFSSDSQFGVILFFILSMTFASTAIVTTFSLPHKLLSKEVIGSAMGIVNMGGQVAGFLAPLVMGFLISGFGTYTAAFWFLIGGGILSMIAALTIRDKENGIGAKEIESAAK